MIAIGDIMLKSYPEDVNNPLQSAEPVDDETAKLALRNFFEAVLEADGQRELRRMYEAFYEKFHGPKPVLPYDWSDKEDDGNRKVRPPGAIAARNGT